MDLAVGRVAWSCDGLSGQAKKISFFPVSSGFVCVS